MSRLMSVAMTAGGRLVALTDTGTYVVLPEHPNDCVTVRGIHATEES